MGKRARIFFAGLGASFLFLAAVLVLARPASDDPSSRPQAVDPFSTMRVTLPAAAERQRRPVTRYRKSIQQKTCSRRKGRLRGKTTSLIAEVQRRREI